jgi:WD40 repeat protein
MPDDPEHIEHTGVISSLAFSPDGRTLATASMDHSIRLWDFTTRQRLTTLQGHLHEVWSIAFSPDGKNLVSGAKDGDVKIWPTARQQKDDVLAGARLPLGFSKDGHTLAALTREGVALFNLTTSEPEQQFSLERSRFRFGPGFGQAAAFSKDLRTLVQNLDDGSVKIWNTETRDSTTLRVSEHPVEVVSLSPDGHTLITGGWGRHLRWWDLRSGTNLVVDTEANRALFSPDGRSVATFQRGATIEIWDVATRSLRTNFVVDPQPGFGAAFSPDGKLLAVVCQDDAIHLLEAATGNEIGTFTGHKQAVSSVAFSPDGETLATASEDSTLKLWNVATQQELLTIRRLGGALRGLMFSPDQRLLVGGTSSSKAGGVRFYRAPLLAEIDAAHAVSSRTVSASAAVPAGPERN